MFLILFSLEPPVPTIYVLMKNISSIFFSGEIFNFTAEKKNLCVLHGQVFVMVLLAAALFQLDTDLSSRLD